MTKSALLVVDMQEDFCPPHGALAVAGGRDIASPISRLLAMPFALTVATRDWHPIDHVSFDICNQPPNNKAFECSTMISNPQNAADSMAIPIWPVHCVQGTPGAEIIPEINISEVNRVIDKGQDKGREMFSPFADTFGNKSNAASFDLAAYLNENGISRVFVVGIAGEHCVRCTAIDAKKEGFEVYVVEEGVKCIDYGEDGWEATRRQFEKAGIRLVSIEGLEV
ncbi:NAD(+) salvage pathway protein [Xanthoria parietina]